MFQMNVNKWPKRGKMEIESNAADWDISTLQLVDFLKYTV